MPFVATAGQPLHSDMCFCESFILYAINGQCAIFSLPSHPISSSLGGHEDLIYLTLCIFADVLYFFKG